jgi:hypothetical protein
VSSQCPFQLYRPVPAESRYSIALIVLRQFSALLTAEPPLHTAGTNPALP